MFEPFLEFSFVGLAIGPFHETYSAPVPIFVFPLIVGIIFPLFIPGAMLKVIFKFSFVMMTVLFIRTLAVTICLSLVPLSHIVVETRVDYPAETMHLVLVPCPLVNGAFIPDHNASALPYLLVPDCDTFSFVPAILVLFLELLPEPLLFWQLDIILDQVLLHCLGDNIFIVIEPPKFLLHFDDRDLSLGPLRVPLWLSLLSLLKWPIP
jgi:hypothetical protein